MRTLLTALAVAGFALSSTLPAYAQLVQSGDKFLGCILKGRAGKRKPAPATFDAYFDKVSPENSGKWGNVERERDVYDWSALDEHYGYAQTRGLPFTLHALLWSEEEPDWVTTLTPDQLRAEIDEWFRDAAARYPGVHSIDVVNEAPHGKTGSPAVVNALGGPGATGYDHVVEAFRMARAYFPEAILIMNDYDVLKRADYAEYDACALALLDAGVVDALGVQAHFLEGTSASRVRERLDYLHALTALPIYVTELELALAGDGAQLDKYRELFPVIYEHEAVAGVTLWGYEEGALWRDEGYLLRADGTERPALGWLRDYLAEQTGSGSGTGGTPEPTRLEAEDHDGQQGVVTWGSAVGYCDDGDWIRFDDVALAAETEVTVRYARGNRQDSRVDVRVGGPGGRLIGSFAALPTGGWGAYAKTDFALATAPGAYDLYFVFVGGDGVGNFDYFDLAPVDEPPTSQTTTVEVVAAGRLGTERMRLEVGGQTVATFDGVGGDPSARVFEAFTYVHPGPLTASEVRVRFDNDDGRRRDLRVDALVVGGVRHEAEAASTYSVGSWERGSNCAGGYKASEWLHCNGYFDFDRAKLQVRGEDVAPLDLQLSPNPVSDAVVVDWGTAATADVTVVNALGQAQYTRRRAAGPQLLTDASAWPAGVYHVRVRAGGALQTGTLVVR